MDWFLHYNGLRHERVKPLLLIFVSTTTYRILKCRFRLFGLFIIVVIYIFLLTLLYFNSHDGGLYQIKTSSLMYRANKQTGLYMMVTSVMKEFNQNLKQFAMVRYCIVKYSVLSSVLNICLSDLSQFRNYVRTLTL